MEEQDHPAFELDGGRELAADPKRMAAACADATEFLRGVLWSFVTSSAPDLSMEVEGGAGCVRFRLDGRWQRVWVGLERELMRKVMRAAFHLAGLYDVPGQGPRDGNIVVRFDAGAGPVTAVLRIAAMDAEPLPILMMRRSDVGPSRLDELGFEQEQLEDIRAVLSSREPGLVLACGPAGTGRTMTIQAMLNFAAAEGNADNIWVCGDPIEYRPERGEYQMEASGDYKLEEFLAAAVAARANLVALSELRTAEHLRLALDAAQHTRVLAVMHHPSAAALLKRIGRDLPLAEVLPRVRLVVAQRLVRVRCQFCQSPADYVEGVTRPQGCAECFLSGYLGRRVLAEVLRPTTTLRRMIASGLDTFPLADAVERPLNELAAAGRFLTLVAVAGLLVARGLTTAAEVCRALGIPFEPGSWPTVALEAAAGARNPRDPRIPQPAGVRTPYVHGLARDVVRHILLHVSTARGGGGVKLAEVYEFLVAHGEFAALEDAMCSSDDEAVRSFWREFRRGTADSLRASSFLMASAALAGRPGEVHLERAQIEPFAEGFRFDV